MEWLVGVTFIVSLLSSILSGISGGGGGFIVMPYYLFIGLPPAQALATAKLGGVGTAFGGLTVLKGKGLINKRWLYIFMAITFVCALVSAWLIPRIDATLFENVIGFALIALAPTLFINKKSLQPGERSGKWLVWGFIAYTIFSFLQTLLGTAMGTILVLILMFLFGMGALEATATKRVAQAVQAVLLFVLLALQGLVVWAHGLAGLVGTLIGSHIGTKIAIKKGDRFVKYVLAGVMAVSGLLLVVY